MTTTVTVLTHLEASRIIDDARVHEWGGDYVPHLSDLKAVLCGRPAAGCEPRPDGVTRARAEAALHRWSVVWGHRRAPGVRDLFDLLDDVTADPLLVPEHQRSARAALAAAAARVKDRDAELRRLAAERRTA